MPRHLISDTHEWINKILHNVELEVYVPEHRRPNLGFDTC